MKFGEKLKHLRGIKRMTQEEAAKAIGITKRAYVAYELDGAYPRSKKRLDDIANLFEVSVSYLYSDDELFTEQAREKYGARGADQARVLVTELAGMFAGGELSEEDRDAVMHALQKAYWTAKENNKKYIPDKYKEK